jgi:hypothetical protein
VAQASLFGLLLWRHPVVTVWVFLLPHLLAGVGGVASTAVALLPLAALGALCLAAWARGMASGLWIASWELAAAAVALVLLWLTTARVRRAGRMPRASREGGRSGPARPSRRRGLVGA